MKNILLSILLLTTITLPSQDKTDITEKEDIQSIDDERRDILQYGIDSEVKELISKFTKEKVDGFTPELVKILERSLDEGIRTAIFEYFILMEMSEGEKIALEIYDAIEYEDEYKDKFAAICIKYLSEIGSVEAINRVSSILDSDNNTILTSALKLIGENSVIEQEAKLLEMLDDDETDDIIYLEVIKTLGRIKSISAIELLIPIADDTDEETTVRNAACYSLGEIGDKKAIPVLKRCLADNSNYLLRKSALDALGKFETTEMDDILMEALRDDQWQIRVAASKSLAERKVVKAYPNLKYVALKDPEAKLKKEALKAIGDINSDECRNFLKKIYNSEKGYTDSAKIIAIDKLIEYNVDWIFPSIEKLYKEKNSEKRKPILDYTLKLLSKTEYKYASELYGKMLDHENYLYKVYAIQGIRLNKYSEHKETIQTLSEEDKNKNVKKHALSTLEEL